MERKKKNACQVHKSNITIYETHTPTQTDAHTIPYLRHYMGEISN